MCAAIGCGRGAEAVDAEKEALCWPLALDPNSPSRNSAACRTVLCCRVGAEMEVGGAPYLLLYVRGLAFALHQIRHMVGAAVAVAHRLIPVDILRIALRSPFQLDVAPLVPGHGEPSPARTSPAPPFKSVVTLASYALGLSHVP